MVSWLPSNHRSDTDSFIYNDIYVYINQQIAAIFNLIIGYYEYQEALRQYEELEGLLLVVPETILPTSNWPLMLPDDLLEARKNSFTTTSEKSITTPVTDPIGGEEKAVWEVNTCIYICICVYMYVCMVIA
jgi:hypothetical protein